MSKKKPQSNDAMHPSASGWMDSIRAEFHDWTPADLVLLEAAAWSLHRVLQARETLAAEGLFIQDRFGITKEHPAAAVERMSANQMRLMLRELALGDAAPAEIRGPRTKDYA